MDEILYEKPILRSRPKCRGTIDLFTGEAVRGGRTQIPTHDELAMLRILAAKHPEGCSREQARSSCHGAGMPTGIATKALKRLEKIGSVSLRITGRESLVRISEAGWLWIRNANIADEAARSAPPRRDERGGSDPAQASLLSAPGAK
jgi:hypothetical protein